MKLICRSDPPIIQAISGRYGPKDGEMKYIWGPWNGSTSQHENIYSNWINFTEVKRGQMGSYQFKNDPGQSLDWQLGDGRDIDQILVSHDKEKPCCYTFYIDIISK